MQCKATLPFTGALSHHFASLYSNLLHFFSTFGCKLSGQILPLYFQAGMTMLPFPSAGQGCIPMQQSTLLLATTQRRGVLQPSCSTGMGDTRHSHVLELPPLCYPCAVVLLILISAVTKAIKVALLCSATSLGVSLEEGVVLLGIDF